MGVVVLGEVGGRDEVLGGVAELDGARAVLVGDLQVVERDEAARVARVGDRVDDAQQLVSADLLGGDPHVLERAHDLLGRAGELRGRLLAGRRLDGHDEQSAPLDVLLGLGDLTLDDLVDVAAEAVAGVVALDGRQEGVLAERVAVDDAAQDLDLEVHGVVERVEQFRPVLVDLALLGLAGRLEAGVLELHDAAVDALLELDGAVLAQKLVAERVLRALVGAQHERAGVVLSRQQALHALLLSGLLRGALAALAGLRGLRVELLLAACVATLGADVVAALLAPSMAPVPVRILCAGRVAVVIVWVALRLGCGLAVRRRARGCRGLAVIVLVRVAGCGEWGMFPVGAASAGYGVVPIRVAGGRFLPAAARGGAVVVIVGVAGRLGCGLAVCRRARRRRGLAVVVIVGVALGGGRRRGALPASVCGLRAVVVRGGLRGLGRSRGHGDVLGAVSRCGRGGRLLDGGHGRGGVGGRRGGRHGRAAVGAHRGAVHELAVAVGADHVNFSVISMPRPRRRPPSPPPSPLWSPSWASCRLSPWRRRGRCTARASERRTGRPSASRGRPSRWRTTART